MKTTCLLLLFFVSPFILRAQETTVPQPDFVHVPMYYMEGSTQLNSLPKNTPGVIAKLGKTMYELPETQSATRIKSTDPYVFIMKTADVDPSTFTTLYKLTQTKKSRQATMALTGLTSISMDTKEILPYKLVKSADHLYRLQPEVKLEPGEYMWVVGGYAYSFGID